MALKAALTVSSVNVRRYAVPNTSAKSAFALMKLLELTNLFFPDLLHLRETYDIETLQHMGTVRRIAENDDVMFECIAKEFRGVVGTMPVH